MTKYTLIAEHTDLYTGNTIAKSTHEFEVDGLMDVIENMELFLKGAGFVFDGVLDIVPTEEQFQGDGRDGMGSIDEWTKTLREDAISESPWAAAHYGHDLKGNK